MIWFVILLLFLIFSSIEYASTDSIHSDYLSKNSTNVIKGIFVFLIVISHSFQYIKPEGIYDEAYVSLREYLHQMVVIMFFFYSGYGILESMKKKGFDYVKNFPVRRYLPVQINTIITVVLYLILGMFIDIDYTVSLSNILLACIGYKSVGNSNWYMFNILIAYICVIIAFFASYLILKHAKVEKLKLFLGLIILTILIALFVYWQIHTSLPHYYYDTVIFLAVGGWWSLFKDLIDKLLNKKDFIYFLIVLACLVVHSKTLIHRWQSFGIYLVWAFTFCVLVLLFTMKIRIKSSLLQFLGEHIFSIYMLQRIPMLIMNSTGVPARHKYIFVIVSFSATLCLIKPFEIVTGNVTKFFNKIDLNKKQNTTKKQNELNEA